MKHSIFALLLVLFVVISCAPVKIVMNSANADGERTILTSDKSLFFANSGDISAALGVRIKGKDTIMGILLTYEANTGHGVFDKGNRLMFRLSDNSEIILSNLYDKEFENIDETTVTHQYRSDYGVSYSYDPWYETVVVTPYEVSRLVPQIRHYKTTNSYALYLVTKQQILDIISKDVKKLRVEIEDRDLDETDTEGISGIFSELYDCLMKVAPNPVHRSEF